MTKKYELSLHDRRENFRIQVLLIAAALSNVLWPLAVSSYDSSQVDSWTARLALSAAFLGLLFLSVYRAPTRANRDLYLLVPTVSLTLYAYFLLTWNHWHPHHLIGTYIVAFAAFAMLVRPWATALYSAVLLGTFLLAGLSQPSPEPMLPVLWTVTLVIVGVVVNLMRTQILVELAATDQESAAVLSSMVEGVVVHGPGGEIVSFNPAAPRILGLSPEQLLGKVSSDTQFKTYDDKGDVIPPERHPASVALREGRTVTNFPMIVARPDGANAHILINAIPVFGRGGSKLSFVVVTFQDITNLRVAEAQLREQQTLLISNSKLSALGEMAAGIAHEINNPLAVIAMHAEYLKTLVDQNPMDKSLAHRELDSVQATIERISRIIRSMRNLVRESGQDPFEAAPVRRIVEDTLEIMREKFRKIDADLVVDIPAGLQVECRTGQISQIVLNLVHNAYDELIQVDRRKLEVTSVDRGDRIEIRFRDSGRGIPPLIRQRIWQPFFTTKGPGDGTGLGLSISRAIANQHSGELHLDERDELTCFVLTLPKRQAPRKAAA